MVLEEAFYARKLFTGGSNMVREFWSLRFYQDKTRAVEGEEDRPTTDNWIQLGWLNRVVYIYNFTPARLDAGGRLASEG